MSNRIQDNRAITSTGTVSIASAPASAKGQHGLFSWLIANQSESDPVIVGLYASSTAIIGPLYIPPASRPFEAIKTCDPRDFETWLLVTGGVALTIVTTAVGTAGFTSLVRGKTLLLGGN